MWRLVLAFSAWLVSCGPPAYEAYFARERRYLKAGVDLAQEQRAVRSVLAQRHLSVVSEIHNSAFSALGAETFDRRLSAVRVITQRGVVVAEDAASDDLFAPGHVSLLDGFPASLGEYTLVALLRTPEGRDRGCVSLYRILEDGSTVPVVLDVSSLGTRACVSDLARGVGGRLAVSIAFPGLFFETTPYFAAELGFPTLPLGQPAPMVLVARVVENGDWLEAERARLASALPAASPFATRHAVGVARAALVLLSGQDTSHQVAAYREAVGRIMPGSLPGEMVAGTLDLIERGWMDGKPVPAAEQASSSDETVIEPPQSPGPPAAPGTEDSSVIEPPATETESSTPPPSATSPAASPDAIVVEPP